MSNTEHTTQSTEPGMTVTQSPGKTEGRSFIVYYTPKQRVFRGLRGLTQHVNNASDLNEIRLLILDRLEKLASWESELCNADPEEEELEKQYPIPDAFYT